MYYNREEPFDDNLLLLAGFCFFEFFPLLFYHQLYYFLVLCSHTLLDDARFNDALCMFFLSILRHENNIINAYHCQGLFENHANIFQTNIFILIQIGFSHRFFVRSPVRYDHYSWNALMRKSLIFALIFIFVSNFPCIPFQQVCCYSFRL